MLLIWRGWGLLAVVVFFPVLASCIGLITVEPMWIFWLVVWLLLLLAGAVCVSCGTRWNNRGTEHSFYFIPLEVCGYLYLSAVGGLSLLWVAFGILVLIYPPPGKPNPGRLHPVYGIVFGSVGLVVTVLTTWALTRLAQHRHDDASMSATDATNGDGSEPEITSEVEPGAEPDSTD